MKLKSKRKYRCKQENPQWGDSSWNISKHTGSHSSKHSGSMLLAGTNSPTLRQKTGRKKKSWKIHIPPVQKEKNHLQKCRLVGDILVPQEGSFLRSGISWTNHRVQETLVSHNRSMVTLLASPCPKHPLKSHKCWRVDWCKRHKSNTSAGSSHLLENHRNMVIFLFKTLSYGSWSRN